MSSRMQQEQQEKIQKKVDSFFSSYREEKINGVTFQLMPAVGDIPQIKSACYDAVKDIVQILFFTPDKPSKRPQGAVVFLEDSQNRLAGIQILDVKKKAIEDIKVEITSTLNEIKEVIIKLGQNPEPKRVARIDIEGRKIDFFKAVIEEDMSDLITCER